MPLFENNAFGVRDLIILQSHINGVDGFQLTQDELDTAGITGDLDDKLNSIADDILLTANAYVIFGDSNDDVLLRAEVNGELNNSSYSGISKDDIVSVEITGSLVTSIGDQTFRDCSNLTSVTIPDSVTSIGTAAFRKCEKMTSITIPDSVESMGDSAFEHCEALTSITLPTNDNFTTIGTDAFAQMYELTEITIPDSVTSIGTNAFLGDSKLDTIYMSDSVRGNLNAAYGSSLIFGDNQSFFGATVKIVNVNANVFFRDSNDDVLHRTEVNGELSDSSYSGISKDDIVSVEITGSNVTSLGQGVFYGCSSLVSITIPDSVTSIDGQAFYGCSSLTGFTIPDSVVEIKASTFEACSKLTNITIHDSITKIGNEAFYQCEALLSVSIPNSVESIGTGAFRDCSLLNSVTIGTSVETIGNSAFNNCAITNITIPDSVKSIGENAFRGCGSLTSISLPNNSEFTTISNNIFRDCSKLITITIPNSVTDVGNYVFNGCSNLATIYMSAATASSIGISFGQQDFRGTSVNIVNVNANVIFRDANDDVLHRTEVNGELSDSSYSFSGISKMILFQLKLQVLL